MSGFTKGPWIEGIDGNNHVYGPDGMGQDSGLLAVVYKGRGNIRLIAAAPDMYEALKEAYAFIADQYCDAESQALDGEYVSREARPLWDTICNAMAKAEGE